jgi:hypothetical protein
VQRQLQASYDVSTTVITPVPKARRASPKPFLPNRCWSRWTRGNPRFSCTYAYNNLGDPVSAIYNDGNTPVVAYAYDRRGRFSSVLCNGITTTRTYNGSDQVVSESYYGKGVSPA